MSAEIRISSASDCNFSAMANESISHLTASSEIKSILIFLRIIFRTTRIGFREMFRTRNNGNGARNRDRNRNCHYNLVYFFRIVSIYTLGDTGVK